MKQIPQIKAEMTPFPHWVAAEAGLDAARKLMDEHNFHHLPVMEDDELVGVISDRDLQRAAELSRVTNSLPPQIGDACERHAYTVELSEPLDVVLQEMSERRIESALVTKEGRLAGIFTTTDACKSLGRLLRQLFPKGENDVA